MKYSTIISSLLVTQILGASTKATRRNLPTTKIFRTHFQKHLTRQLKHYDQLLKKYQDNEDYTFVMKDSFFDSITPIPNEIPQVLDVRATRYRAYDMNKDNKLTLEEIKEYFIDDEIRTSFYNVAEGYEYDSYLFRIPRHDINITVTEALSEIDTLTRLDYSDSLIEYVFLFSFQHLWYLEQSKYDWSNLDSNKDGIIDYNEASNILYMLPNPEIYLKNRQDLFVNYVLKFMDSRYVGNQDGQTSISEVERFAEKVVCFPRLLVRYGGAKLKKAVSQCTNKFMDYFGVANADLDSIINFDELKSLYMTAIKKQKVFCKDSKVPYIDRWYIFDYNEDCDIWNGYGFIPKNSFDIKI